MEHHKNEQPLEEISSLQKIDTGGQERAPEARGRESDEVTKDYWFSLNFIGSVLAIGFALVHLFSFTEGSFTDSL